MEKNTKKIVLISVSLLAIGGAIGFWLWMRNKDKKSTEVPLATDDSGTPAPPTSTGTIPKADGPSDVKDFQDWMDKYYPNWVNGKNLNKGSGYGTYGPSTQKAWATYKGEYQKGSTPTTTPKKVKADYFTDPSKMVGQKVYAIGSIGLYNFSSVKIGTARVNEYLGVVKKVERTTSGNYWLSLQGPLGVDYNVSSLSVYFLV